MSFFTKVRNGIESAAVVVGDYYLPGSSVFTSNLAAKGSQEQLSTPLGRAAQIGSSALGFGLIPGQLGSSGGALEHRGIRYAGNLINGWGSAAGAAAIFGGGVGRGGAGAGGGSGGNGGAPSSSSTTYYDPNAGTGTNPAIVVTPQKKANDGITLALIVGGLSILAKAL